MTWDDSDFVGGNGSRFTATVHFSVAHTHTFYTDYDVTGSVAIETRQRDCTTRTVTLPVRVNPAFGGLTVSWSSDGLDMTYALTIETDLTPVDIQCSDGTRTLTLNPNIDCHGVPYTEAAMLSTMDASMWCSAPNASVHLTQQ